MKSYTVLAAAILVCAIAAVVLCGANRNDINITFSETKDDITLSASFPDHDSERVQEYVKSQLQLKDLSDFKHLKTKQYSSPDQQMHFSIKSGTGHIKIVLDKVRSSSGSYRQLKKIGEGLNKLLTQG